MQCYFKATIQKREQIQLGKLSKIIEEHIPDLQISKSRDFKGHCSAN